MDPHVDYDKLLQNYFRSERRSTAVRLAQKIRSLQRVLPTLNPANLSFAHFVSQAIEKSGVTLNELPELADISNADAVKATSVTENPTEIPADALSQLMIAMHLPLDQVRILLTNSLRALHGAASVSRALPRATPDLQAKKRKQLVEKGLDALFVQLSSQGGGELSSADSQALHRYLSAVADALKKRQAEYLVSQ